MYCILILIVCFSHDETNVVLRTVLVPFDKESVISSIRTLCTALSKAFLDYSMNGTMFIPSLMVLEVTDIVVIGIIDSL